MRLAYCGRRMTAFGCTTMTEPLRRVLVRRPSAAAGRAWRDYGWRSEPDAVAIADDLARLGIPVAGRVSAPHIAEGGDLIRLDERTLLAGRGYRTSAGGIAEIAR